MEAEGVTAAAAAAADPAAAAVEGFKAPLVCGKSESSFDDFAGENFLIIITCIKCANSCTPT